MSNPTKVIVFEFRISEGQRLRLGIFDEQAKELFYPIRVSGERNVCEMSFEAWEESYDLGWSTRAVFGYLIPNRPVAEVLYFEAGTDAEADWGWTDE